MMIVDPVLIETKARARLICVKKPWSGVWLSDCPSVPINEATSKLTALSEI